MRVRPRCPPRDGRSTPRPSPEGQEGALAQLRRRKVRSMTQGCSQNDAHNLAAAQLRGSDCSLGAACQRPRRTATVGGLLLLKEPSSPVVLWRGALRRGGSRSAPSFLTAPRAVRLPNGLLRLPRQGSGATPYGSTHAAPGRLSLPASQRRQRKACASARGACCRSAPRQLEVFATAPRVRRAQGTCPSRLCIARRLNGVTSHPALFRLAAGMHPGAPRSALLRGHRCGNTRRGAARVPRRCPGVAAAIQPTKIRGPATDAQPAPAGHGETL